MPSFGPAIHNLLSAYAEKCDLRDVPIRVNVVSDVVSSYSQVSSITIRQARIKTKHVIGQVRFFRDLALYNDTDLHAIIYLVEGLNDCWQRYVACKEIMHCILDDADHVQVGNLDRLKELGEQLTNRSLQVLTGETPFNTELDADIMATEVLFPLELREQYVERYNQGLLTDMQIALRFKIPEVIVRGAMAPRYMNAIRGLRQDSLVALPAG